MSLEYYIRSDFSFSLQKIVQNFQSYSEQDNSCHGTNGRNFTEPQMRTLN